MGWSKSIWNTFYSKGIPPLWKTERRMQKYLEEMREENPETIWIEFRKRFLQES